MVGLSMGKLSRLFRRALAVGDGLLGKLAHLVSAIAPAHDDELQPGVVEAAARLHQQRVRADLRFYDRESGWTPRGLTDTGHAFRFEPQERGGDGRTCKAAALRLRKIIADGALDLADRSTELRAILLHQRGHETHQRQVCEVCRLVLWKSFQRSKRFTLGLAE